MAERAIIFDVNGTLVDTNQVHVKTWLEAFKALGMIFHATR